MYILFPASRKRYKIDMACPGGVQCPECGICDRTESDRTLVTASLSHGDFKGLVHTYLLLQPPLFDQT
jgi:hypothetical protein